MCQVFFLSVHYKVCQTYTHMHRLNKITYTGWSLLHPVASYPDPLPYVQYLVDEGKSLGMNAAYNIHM